MGTDGRWNGANSPIDPWQHGHEGGGVGPNGAIGRITYRLDPRVGPLHRETAWLGAGQYSGRTKLSNPRAPPMPSDAD
jgi:hypothetical protein